ncbi:MAG: hypothetical protein KDK30_09765 [Leptospiraceae bacterium]|nr:hypothetical protein [Leptospiraceae bacterium]MCB1318041.1 hypothetical protein [Leptospiraceae bacterium]MCB1320176.1 hypothetical protein [Leptospiraceae bacterium]
MRTFLQSKRRAVLATAIALFSGMFAFTAVYAIADEVQEITISNQIGADINLLFVSPGDSNYWGPDILGSERVFPAGADLSFYLHYPQACGKFDLLAIDDSGKSYTIYNQEVCDSEPAATAFTAENRNPEEDRELNFAQLSFSNELGMPIHFLFISPSDSDMWGADFLDATSTMDAGSTVTFLAPIYQEAVRYNVLAVDENGDHYAFNIDVQGDGARSYPIELSDKQ